MKRVVGWMILVLLCVPGREARGKMMENPLTLLKPQVHRLENGLTVFLLRDARAPLVAIDINYRVGSRNERPGRTGFAHLFEHLMFQGSAHFNDDFFKPLQDIGGAVNGATGTDRTRYWEVVPSAWLERALWLESDRMGFLLDAITQERLDNQRSVVQNERRQNYENRPYGLVWERILQVLYPPNHPYSWPTIGSMADLDAASLDDVKDFFRTWYGPDNATLSIVGDFDPDVAMTLVRKYFGAFPPGPPRAQVQAWVPALSRDLSLEMEDRVQLPRTYWTWHSVPLFSPDDAAMDVLAQVLGGGKTSRLYQQLVHRMQIAQDASAFHGSSQLSGILQVVLTPKPGHSLEEVEAAAAAVIDDLVRDGITREELERTVTSIAADFLRSMENIGGFGGIADRMNLYAQHLGDPDRFRWDLDRYLGLTREQVRDAARRILRAPKVALRVIPRPASLGPATEGTASPTERSSLPGRGRDADFHLPTRQVFTLPNGLEVSLVERHEVPLVFLGMILPGGLSAEPPDRSGLASLTTDLLEEGAAGKTSQEIAEALERLGAQFEAQANTDAVLARMSLIRPRLPESMRLFADLLLRPDFPEDEVERQRDLHLVDLVQARDVPTWIAAQVSRKVLFGDHPYGRSPMGTEAGLRAVQREDVARWWRSRMRPAGARLLVVGDVDRNTLEPLVRDLFGTWKDPEGAPDPALPPLRSPDASRIYLVDRPGAAQSVIIAALPGPARNTPDFPVLEVLEAALGGQFVSRLNLNLREDKGYTYGARAQFQYSRFAGALVATAPVETRVTVPALQEILRELDDVRGKRPILGQELEYAVNSLVNGYPRRFETLQKVASRYLDLILYGLPEETLVQYPAMIRRVSPEDLERAASRYLDMNRVSIVVVGDAARIREDLEALGRGPVVMLDPDGNPL
ncbi:MAG TPA: pitrilysin family protein [Myxococcota bacterium]|nr:pitrilysin family protein [Myxococcota bacterium]HQK50736.1 pitrilysin family protein [Myxococcota bacterium]